jgi:3-phenylpropionate/trans-cinnamate dioxygenase ferredoxin component
MTRVLVTSLERLPDGVGIRVDAGVRRLALFRRGNEVFALDDRCSHAEASLAEGEVYGDTVECPRHGSAFDLRTGAALSLPATCAVATYLAEVVGGDVFVDTREEGA